MMDVPPATFAQAAKIASMAKMHNVLVCHLKFGTRGDTRIEKTTKVRHFNEPRLGKKIISGH